MGAAIDDKNSVPVRTSYLNKLKNLNNTPSINRANDYLQERKSEAD